MCLLVHPSYLRWLPSCASILVTYKDKGLPLISSSDQVSSDSIQMFLNCVAALMSLQLRSLVIESLQDLLKFFMIHEVWIKNNVNTIISENSEAFQLISLWNICVCLLQEGNDFGEVFDEMTYVQPQVLLVKLRVDEPHIEFSPSFQECWEVMQRAFMEIVKSAKKLPRVKTLPDYHSLCKMLLQVFFIAVSFQVVFLNNSWHICLTRWNANSFLISATCTFALLDLMNL